MHITHDLWSQTFRLLMMRNDKFVSFFGQTKYMICKISKSLDLYWQAAVRSHNQNSWPGAQTEMSEDIKNPDHEHKNAHGAQQMPAICHLLINSPSAWESLIRDSTNADAHVHNGMSKSSHTFPTSRGQNLSRRPTLLLTPLGLAFYSTPLSCVLTTRVVLVEGQELIDRNSGKHHCRSFTASLKSTQTGTSEVCFQ